MEFSENDQGVMIFMFVRGFERGLLIALFRAAFIVRQHQRAYRPPSGLLLSPPSDEEGFSCKERALSFFLLSLLTNPVDSHIVTADNYLR